MLKKLPLHTLIFLGLIFGVLAGVVVRNLGLPADQVTTIVSYIKPIGDIFLRMVFMMVIPLILSALTLGVSDFGDMGRLGRVGWRLLKYTLIVTLISVGLGVGLTKLVQPGKGLSVADREQLVSQFSKETKKLKEQTSKVDSTGNFLTTLVKVVPKNPLEDMTRAFDPTYTGGGLLAVMFFSLIFGVALAASDPVKVSTLRSMLTGLYEVTMKVISYAMYLAPFGVAALMFALTATTGIGILKVLVSYMLLVLGALAIHLFITYSVVLKYFSGMSPRFFFRQCREVMLTAFSTSSSNATLPTAVRTATDKLKLPRDVSHFVLTIGSTGNQNGTALYEGITILFLAQCFGVDLGLREQIGVVLVSVVAGMGTAGVPGGSLPVMMLILESVGVPGESIALIIGVDRILDMSRTVLNVTGDIVATAYIAHQEGESGISREIRQKLEG